MVFILLLSLLISLGIWQLDRAQQKNNTLALKMQNHNAPSLLIDSNTADQPTVLRYREATVQGHYDIERQFLIDNQVVKGKPGYFVMTPFKINQSDQAVLVNRGWVALNLDRLKLPEISLKQVATQISGRINHFPSVGIKLPGAEIPTETWPSVVQVVDVKILSKKLGYALLHFQLELHQDMPDGFVREWKTDTVMPPEKHIAYAVQWFGLALTLTFLFFWNSCKKNPHGKTT